MRDSSALIKRTIVKRVRSLFAVAVSAQNLQVVGVEHALWPITFGIDVINVQQARLFTAIQTAPGAMVSKNINRNGAQDLPQFVPHWGNTASVPCQRTYKPTAIPSGGQRMQTAIKRSVFIQSPG